MSYVSKNPRFESEILTDQGTAAVSSAPTGAHRVLNRSGTLYVKNSSGSEVPIGSGGASGKNYLSAWFNFSSDPSSGMVTNLTATGNRTSNTTVWGGSTTGLLSQNTTTPLRGTTSANIAVIGAAGAQFVESPLFTLEAADLGKVLTIYFDYSAASGFANGDIDLVVVHYNSSGTYLETLTPSITLMPSGNGQVQSAFNTSSTSGDQYSLRWRSQNASSRTLTIASLSVGPQTTIIGAVVQDLQSFGTNPTPNNFGTVSNSAYAYCRTGDRMKVFGSFQSGTRVASAASLTLPSGFAIDTTKIKGATYHNIAGIWWTGAAGSPFYAAATTGAFGCVIVDSTDSANLYFSGSATATTGLNKDIGTNIGADSTYIHFEFEIPISSWSSSVNLASSQPEFVSNSDATSTASNTTSFATTSAAGSSIPNGGTGTTYIRRVRFATPIQPTDKISVEVDQGSSGAAWFEAASWFPRVYQGTNAYGIEVDRVNTTDLDIYFGSGGYASNGATYAAVGPAWSTITSWKWRVRKSVGVNVNALSGDRLGNNGTTVIAGYVGETYEYNQTDSGSFANTVRQLTTAIPIGPGNWLISANVYLTGGNSVATLEMCVNNTAASIANPSWGGNGKTYFRIDSPSTSAMSLATTFHRSNTATESIYLNYRVNATVAGGAPVYGYIMVKRNA